MKKAILFFTLVSFVHSAFSASLQKEAEKALYDYYEQNITLTF